MTSFLDLDVNITVGKWQIGLFDERNSFPFSVVTIPDKSREVTSSLFCIVVESLIAARASNNH